MNSQSTQKQATTTDAKPNSATNYNVLGRQFLNFLSFYIILYPYM